VICVIIVVSDVHVGYDKCNYDEFNHFLGKCNTSDIEHLVLLGDIFDFWRVRNTDVAMNDKWVDFFEILGNLKAKNIHYVVGNHDYSLYGLNERYADNQNHIVYPFPISKFLRLQEGNTNFFFIHGYELEVLLWSYGGINNYEKLSELMCSRGDKKVRGIESRMWEILKDTEWTIEKVRKPPQDRDNSRVDDLAKSKGVHLLLGMRPDEKLVFGHTHRPFNYNDKVINTGSWVSDIPPNTPQNTYVKIADGQIELKTFDESQEL